MLGVLANPGLFLKLSRPAALMAAAVAVVCLGAGLVLGWTAPPDYQQGDTVRIMFIHVPAAWLSLMAYSVLAGASLVGLVWRSLVADCAARAAAPLGAAFTALALITGSIWGRPTWGTWWVWDARLTSVLVLFLFYLGYLAVQSAIEDETKASRAAGVLALVGVVNLPIVHFSVEWWNSLHQGSSVFRADGPTMPPVYLWPLLLTAAGYTGLFVALWLVRTRAELRRRRTLTLRSQALWA